MPELDVLRGLAILMVVLFHGLYWSGAYSSIRLVNLVFKATVVGWLGVNLFFVLSGFLITGILIDTKSDPSYYRSFYRRRVFRILPAYFATIAILVLFHSLRLPQIVLALLFLANYSECFRVTAGGYGPFWSLSVEEQFYLLWPAVVAKVRTRTLTRICLALCVLEPFLRFLSASGRVPLGGVRTASYLIADNLAMGALAAIFARSVHGSCRNAIRLGSALCLAGVVILLLGYPFGIFHRNNVIGNTFQAVPWNIFFTGMLLLFLGLRSPFFTSRWTAPLRFLGYISYSLYLIHVFVFYCYDQLILLIAHNATRYLLQAAFVRFIFGAAFSIAIAWLSRRFYEEPFLRIGRDVKPSTRVPAAA